MFSCSPCVCRWVTMTFTGMDISRKQDVERERKLQRQEAVMMTVEDRRGGSAHRLLPGIASRDGWRGRRRRGGCPTAWVTRCERDR